MQSLAHAGVIGEWVPLPALPEAMPRAYARRRGRLGGGRLRHHDHRPRPKLFGPGPIAGLEVSVTGIAKARGVIHPDMATMLAFIATDARLAGADPRRHFPSFAYVSRR